jgi:uncharacterized small protein (DUF1192 family)
LFREKDFDGGDAFPGVAYEVQEIDERITTLQAEITRLEEARRAKQRTLSAAFFKFDESS